jgi:hypothetical protein
MSANINNVINVQLNQAGSLAQADNVNVVCVVTNNDQIGLSANNRTESFTDLASVGSTFGTLGSEYAYAQSFFSTRPNSVNAGGRLVFGFRDTATGTPGFGPTLESATSDETTLVSSMQLISDGYIALTYDGITYSIDNLNFTSVTSIFDIAGVVRSGIQSIVGGLWTVFDFSFGGGQVGISIQAPENLPLSFVFDDGSFGTYVGTVLNLEGASGATIFAGSDGTPGANEDVATALDAINAETKCTGFVFIDEATDDAETRDRANYAQASNVLIYDVFSSAGNLIVDPANIVWEQKLASKKNYRMLYSKANDRKLAVSYMARQHSVNFSAENTALTMHLKELSVTPEVYTQSEIDGAKQVGLDLYTTIKNTPVLLTSGANDYTDNVYNLIAFLNDVEINAFNLLKATSTKIAQTNAGVNTLVDNVENTCTKYVNAGFLAAGTWNSTDFFGDLDTFNRNIEFNGFYVKAGSLSAQSAAERQSRKSPVVQVAIKAAGAIHSADIIINFNE